MVAGVLLAVSRIVSSLLCGIFCTWLLVCWSIHGRSINGSHYLRSLLRRWGFLLNPDWHLFRRRRLWYMCWLLYILSLYPLLWLLKPNSLFLIRLSPCYNFISSIIFLWGGRLARVCKIDASNSVYLLNALFIVRDSLELPRPTAILFYVDWFHWKSGLTLAIATTFPFCTIWFIRVITTEDIDNRLFRLGLVRRRLISRLSI
jgi:hypothetical protein